MFGRKAAVMTREQSRTRRSGLLGMASETRTALPTTVTAIWIKLCQKPHLTDPPLSLLGNSHLFVGVLEDCLVNDIFERITLQGAS